MSHGLARNMSHNFDVSLRPTSLGSVTSHPSDAIPVQLCLSSNSGRFRYPSAVHAPCIKACISEYVRGRFDAPTRKGS